ncbi:SRPBCC family protein [Frankia sp. AgB1.9]|uniref:SRPBCC family protein n=1 Tax=unclassified Frankia TaxID=2632575 RepID=UPI00193266BD|nr:MULTISPECIES: SRPBCC family protein [unclassified Frankia]MBL7494634.1 SRPBCC family protein [Frankia sp. AgW1.1]MBL7549641.1 SRPBCC family protein [Frankia sp. AgB1.9]MBL7623315.1 SRPBCC family protein [Frankia sp. AgB1.8]
MAHDDPADGGPAGGATADGGRAGRKRARAESFGLVVESSAPADSVFALLADGGGWAAWAGPLVPRSRWYRTGDPAPGGVGAIRELGLRPVLSREEILEYVPPRRIVYTIVSGIPVDGYRGTVDLDPLPGGGTRITWRSSFVPTYRGTGPALRLLGATIVRSIARHLARAALTHPTAPAPGTSLEG